MYSSGTASKKRRRKKKEKEEREENGHPKPVGLSVFLSHWIMLLVKSTMGLTSDGRQVVALHQNVKSSEPLSCPKSLTVGDEADFADKHTTFCPHCVCVCVCVVQRRLFES